MIKALETKVKAGERLVSAGTKEGSLSLKEWLEKATLTRQPRREDQEAHAADVEPSKQNTEDLR